MEIGNEDDISMCLTMYGKNQDEWYDADICATMYNMWNEDDMQDLVYKVMWMTEPG
jgi:hypothetical protein